METHGNTKRRISVHNFYPKTPVGSYQYRELNRAVKRNGVAIRVSGRSGQNLVQLCVSQLIARCNETRVSHLSGNYDANLGSNS